MTVKDIEVASVSYNKIRLCNRKYLYTAYIDSRALIGRNCGHEIRYWLLGSTAKNIDRAQLYWHLQCKDVMVAREVNNGYTSSETSPEMNTL